MTPSLTSSLVGQFSAAQRDPYSYDDSFEFGAPRTGRYFYLDEPSPRGSTALSVIAPPAEVHWAQVPYPAADFADPVTVNLEYQTVDKGVSRWSHGVRSMRNYDIGTCDVTFDWPALSGMLSDGVLQAMRTNLARGAIPELLNPPARNVCPQLQFVNEVRVDARTGPIFGPSPERDDDRGDRSNLGIWLKMGYSHDALAGGHRAVQRIGQVFINTSIGVQSSTDAAGFHGRPTVRTLGDALIEGDSFSPDASAGGYAPLGWQMATLLQGSPITRSWEGADQYIAPCIPPIAFAPTPYWQILANELDRRMMVYFRFPYAPSSAPSDAASCLDRSDDTGMTVPGRQPQYVFCTTGTASPPASRSSPLTRASAGSCGAGLRDVLRDDDETSPMLRTFERWGVNAEELFHLPDAGCYSLNDLPDWVQAEPALATQIAQNANRTAGSQIGICAVRIQAQRMNVLPEGMQFVVLDDEQISAASQTMPPNSLEPPPSYGGDRSNFLSSLQQFRFLNALATHSGSTVTGGSDALPVRINCDRGIYRVPAGEPARIAQAPSGPRVGTVPSTLQGQASRNCESASCLSNIPAVAPYVGPGPTRCAYSW